jgi:hypothetical protein
MDMTPATHNRPDVLRLAAAAALETYAELGTVDAWIEAGRLDSRTQRSLERAAQWPIRSQAKANVVEIYDRWQRQQGRTSPALCELPTSADQVPSTEYGVSTEA